METRQIHVRDLSTVTGIQQIEHAVQSIYFLGLEDFEGDVYISIESDDYSNEAIPLTNNTFIIGQPMTLHNTTYTCQIYGVVNDGEKIQLSKRFRLIVDKSNDIQGDSSQYPVDPNFENSIIEFVNEQKSGIATYTDDKIDAIQATGDAVIAGIPSDYTALEQATYNAYPTENETGNPIYFDDGADDIPVKELIVNLEPKQEGTGDPSPSNVRPITGFDGVTVKRTGKNILKIEGTTTTTGDITFTVNNNGTITVNGTATANAWFTVQIIQKAFNADMYLSGCHSQNENIRIQVNIDNRAYQCTDEPIFIQAGKVIDTVLIRIASGTTVNNEVFDPMLRVADSTPYFSAYRGQEYSITFPSSVGTVYGGTLNMTTGVLTVDRAKLNNSTWTIDTAGQRAYFSSRATFGASESNNVATDKIICSKLPTISLKALMDDKTQGIALSTSGALSLHIDGVTDESSFTQADVNTWLSDVDIIYKMATPITYQLTPTEVSTLLMGNTFMSDGEINLTYRQDTNTVIDRLVNAIISLGGNI